MIKVVIALVYIVIYLHKGDSLHRRCTDVYPILCNWNNEALNTINCDYRFLKLDKLRQCLTDRNVYFLGNSIARQFAFELPRLLQYNTTIVSREQEKNMCPKQFTENHKSGCSFYLPNNTNIHANWFLFYAVIPILLDGRLMFAVLYLP